MFLAFLRDWIRVFRDGFPRDSGNQLEWCHAEREIAGLRPTSRIDRSSARRDLGSTLIPVHDCTITTTLDI
jgi:hypothetical protein